MSDTGVATQNIRGLVVRGFGNWHETAIETLPCPAPGPGEVLIASEACALNFQDLLLIEGKYQYKPPLPFFAGRDVAGKIVAVGPGVKTLAVGDRVSAQLRYGAFAELALAPVDRCFRLPEFNRCEQRRSSRHGLCYGCRRASNARASSRWRTGASNGCRRWGRNCSDPICQTPGRRRRRTCVIYGEGRRGKEGGCRSRHPDRSTAGIGNITRNILGRWYRAR